MKNMKQVFYLKNNKQEIKLHESITKVTEKRNTWDWHVNLQY